MLHSQISELGRYLWRKDKSRIAAVGIEGSDVYDTLLILQALRSKLSDVVFFTSDLDARFWDPKELSSSRNLVVLSGYGVELTDSLQAGTAPFRESAQCAEFLATLQAIQNENVAHQFPIHPRRFEISQNGPVDMSNSDLWPHPPRRQPVPSNWFLWVILLVMLCAAVSLFSSRLQKLAWRPKKYLRESLEMSEEDFGNTEDVRRVVEALQRNSKDDKLAQWLYEPLAGLVAELPEAHGLREMELEDELTLRLIERCNVLIFSYRKKPLESLGNEEEFIQFPFPSLPAKNVANLTWDDFSANRQALNKFLNTRTEYKPESNQTAKVARQISLLAYKRRIWRPFLFWFVAALVLGGFGSLAIWAWSDNYFDFNGEPFNFAGTSAWPAQFIRFAVCALSVVFIVRTQLRLGEVGWEITRSYRLKPPRFPRHSSEGWSFKAFQWLESYRGGGSLPPGGE